MSGASVQITGVQSVQQRLGRMAAQVGSAAGKKRLFEEAGRYMTGTGIPLLFRRGGPGWATVARGGKPLQDTGRLRDSIRARATSTDLVVGTGLIYAPVHQHGAVIVPRRGKYLAIPLSPPLTVSQRRTMGPRDFPNTFIAKSKRGTLLVFQRTSGGVRPIFLLVKSVRIKQRRFLRFLPEHLQAISRRWAAMVKAGTP